MSRSVKFHISGNNLVLIYTPRDGASWIQRKFKDGQRIFIAKTFSLSLAELLGAVFGYELEASWEDGSHEAGDFDAAEQFLEYEGDIFEVAFKVGRLSAKYIQLNRDVFQVKNDVFFSIETKFNPRLFTSFSGISILNRIDQWVTTPLYIGGDNKNAIPFDEYIRLISSFPTEREIMHYINARIGSVLGEYFASMPDLFQKYQKYMGRRLPPKSSRVFPSLAASELAKAKTLHEKLQDMLKDEDTILESQWQLEIVDFIRLLYPKYLFAFPEAPILVDHQNANRSVDFLLIDAAGNVDIAEIKRPFGRSIVTQGLYRKNHIPLRELSGTIMQVEKYIYFLSRSGARGENKIVEKFRDKLPENFKVHITNPKGIIIMGRHQGLTEAQRSDFEIIRRKYNNVIDILTYDDLIERLRISISELSKF